MTSLKQPGTDLVFIWAEGALRRAQHKSCAGRDTAAGRQGGGRSLAKGRAEGEGAKLAPDLMLWDKVSHFTCLVNVSSSLVWS